MKDIDLIILKIRSGLEIVSILNNLPCHVEINVSLQTTLKSNSRLVRLKDRLGETLLMKSISVYNFEAMVLILRYGGDVGDKDNWGLTALHHAVSSGSTLIVEYLLKNGADVDATAIRPTIPLIIAAKTDGRLVKILLRNRANLSLKSKRLRRCLSKNAVRFNHNFLLEKLELKTFVRQINDKDEQGKTALIHASERGSAQIVRMLLNKNAQINVRDNQGCDAFFKAAQHGHPHIINIFKDHNYTMDGVNLIDEYRTDYPNAIFAALANVRPNWKMIRDLIDMAPESSLNHTNKDGDTLLHITARLQNYSTIKLLIYHQVDKAIVNLSGETALDISVQNGNVKIVQVLIDHVNYGHINVLFQLILTDNRRNLEAYLKVKNDVDKDIISFAVNAIDSEVPELVNLPHCDYFWNTTLGILIKFAPIAKQRSLIEVALNCAMNGDRFKVIHWIWDAGIVDLNEFIEREAVKLTLSLEMKDFLKNFHEHSIPGKVNQISSHDLSDYCFYLMTFSLFLYRFEEHKSIPSDVATFDYLDMSTLKTAISYDREDIATFLLQRGVKPTFDEELERHIELNCTLDFKKLYKESRGGGLLTLLEIARIAMRESHDFDDAWKNKIVQPVLEFRNKSYDINYKDKFGETALTYAIKRNNLQVAIDLIASGFNPNSTKNETIESVIYSASTMKFSRNFALYIFDRLEFSNPLFVVARCAPSDELVRVVENYELNVNEFYDESLTVLHYAVICSDIKIIETLLNLGSQDLPANLSAKHGCLDFAFYFERFDIYELLIDRGFTHKVEFNENDETESHGSCTEDCDHIDSDCSSDSGRITLNRTANMANSTSSVIEHILSSLI